MTPEQQRIAIAEACGWTDFSSAPYEGAIQYGRRPFSCSDSWELPDYLNDLNAMNEAERTLTNLNSYLHFLHMITSDDPTNISNEPAWATAAQRAEAFLRATGKWVES
jgi:hypothetical protein